MISSTVSRTSAVVLCTCGLALLFAPDMVLPRLVPGYPPTGLYLGQLLGAAWLSVAALNWLNQSALLGGIYGRPVVLTNAALYFIGAMVLLKISVGDAPISAVWLVTVVHLLLAAVYGWLLFRGPAERDLRRHR